VENMAKTTESGRDGIVRKSKELGQGMKARNYEDMMRKVEKMKE
jgi:hypothetical protein